MTAEKTANPATDGVDDGVNDAAISDLDPAPDGLMIMAPEVEAEVPTTGHGHSDPQEWQFTLAGHNWSLSQLIGLGVAIACAFFVFMQLRPDLLFADTTPAGGDMGAHVWGPAYLRDHLLPQGRLTGWTPDWYAGFPAYHFYMVVPSLAIVAVNGGLDPLIALPLGAVAVAAVAVATRGRRFGTVAVVATAVLAVLLIALPYGVAFKLVSVSGLVAFPLSAWAMGRLARSREPVPAFLAVGATVFLFDTNFTIYGGNIASTLAGEFAFSISLSLTLLAIGLVMRGMDTGRGRVAAAIVISLVALTHIIPLFFAVVALAVVIALDSAIPRMWPVATGLALALVPTAVADDVPTVVLALAVGAVIVVFGAVSVAEPGVRNRLIWLAVTGPSAALLAGFWLLPFYVREPYFNDMGWERLNEITPAMLTVPMRVALPIALIGVVLAVGLRERIGVLFATMALISAAAVANLGDGPLWNARLLPFFYLSIYLLVAVVSALVIQIVASTVSEDLRRTDHRIVAASSAIAVVVGLIGIAIPLRALPGGQLGDDGAYHWLAFTSHDKSFIPSWTAWNYSGYERKNSYREYRAVVATMAGVGEELGCGRAMWEYSPGLDRYGTPMALMLLPHWTDGCIGSMEGLYFESSATTPFHFLNQSVLSSEPSRAQRDLPYQNFDIERGVAELQVMGVRYYMAQSDEAIAAARANPDLFEVAEAQPYVIFEVSDTDLVEGLAVEPVVVSGRSEEQVGDLATRFDVGWVSQAVTYFNNPAGYEAMPAEDGPAEWKRVESLTPADGESITPAVVTNVATGTSSIRFDVDRVGAPVLVKTSYFPNWTADGAEGPWRIGPNLMVVVPTETTVRLDYGRTLIDWASIVVTVLGLGALFGLSRMDRRTLRLQPSGGDRSFGAEAPLDDEEAAPPFRFPDKLSEEHRTRPVTSPPASPLAPVEVEGEHADGRLAGFLPPGFDPARHEPGAEPAGERPGGDPSDSAAARPGDQGTSNGEGRTDGGSEPSPAGASRSVPEVETKARDERQAGTDRPADGDNGARLPSAQEPRTGDDAETAGPGLPSPPEWTRRPPSIGDLSAGESPEEGADGPTRNGNGSATDAADAADSAGEDVAADDEAGEKPEEPETPAGGQTAPGPSSSADPEQPASQ